MMNEAENHTLMLSSVETQMIRTAVFVLRLVLGGETVIVPAMVAFPARRSALDEDGHGTGVRLCGRHPHPGSRCLAGGKPAGNGVAGSRVGFRDMGVAFPSEVLAQRGALVVLPDPAPLLQLRHHKFHKVFIVPR